MFSSLQKLTKFEENLYEMYKYATVHHQIPGSLIATLAPFFQPWKAMSVRPSAYISAAPTRQISVQFDIGDF